MSAKAGNWGSKYRPTTVEEMVGNREAVEKAKSLIARASKRPDSFPATIGITGPTGTGKTTMARAIAMAINNGSDADIEEVDCGTNGNAEFMRGLEARARYLPKNTFRFFILDEFHLLNKTAASALLKLLEEPPARTRFIWCTDQPAKVLKTLMGRSYLISVQPPTTEELAAYLTHVIQSERIAFGSKSLRATMLKALAIRCDNMPRRAVNELQAVMSIIESRTSALREQGELTRDDLKAIVESVFVEDEKSSPLYAAITIIAASYESNKDALRHALFGFTGDPSHLLNQIVVINAAICRKVAGVPEENRYVTMVNKERQKVRTSATPSTAGPLPTPTSVKLDPFVFQSKLIDIQDAGRLTTIAPEIFIPARLAVVI